MRSTSPKSRRDVASYNAAKAASSPRADRRSRSARSAPGAAEALEAVASPGAEAPEEEAGMSPIMDCGSARGEQDAVDDVDRGVGGLHVAADDLGLADREVLARALDRDGRAGQRLVVAGEHLGGQATLDDVVGEHGGEQALGVAHRLVEG